MDFDGKNMPNIWGTGQLLAFSGMDGFTDWNEPFVLHTGNEPLSLKVRLPVESDIRFDGLRQAKITLLTGDAMIADCAEGLFRIAFADHHTLLGQMPPGARMLANGTAMSETPVSMAEKDGLALLAAASGGRWVLLLAKTADRADAAERCAWALSADIEAVMADRTAFLRNLPVPAGLGSAQTRLFRKAASVIKVNVEAPCGVIKRRWTTPDRWPHRNMWLWDSAFHSVGLACIDVAMAKDAVLAMLEQVGAGGMLPHMARPDGQGSNVTQPPLLAWAALRILQQSDDEQWAGQCLPHLLEYLDWDRTNRDRNGNAIPEWHIEGHPLCRCGESGLDNSPVYDRAVLLDAPDFAAFLCNDYRCTARIAERLGGAEAAAHCNSRAAQIAEAVNTLLWDADAQFYFHRDFDGHFVLVKAISGFMPLFAGIANPPQAAALRDHLCNAATFGAPLPIPSVALDSGTFCKDMWRGPTWMNLSYLAYLGFRQYGYEEEACELRETLLGAIGKWYQQEGCLWEYYDALDITSPRHLDRKQRLISGKGIAPISDYHWTAAITVALLADS